MNANFLMLSDLVRQYSSLVSLPLLLSIGERSGGCNDNTTADVNDRLLIIARMANISMTTAVPIRSETPGEDLNL